MEPPSSTALIYTLYGLHVRRLGGWIAVADLVVLLEALGIAPRAARTAVSRLHRTGMLVRVPRGGQAGYELGEGARAVIEEGDRRIFAAARPADLADGWVLVVASVPEDQRDRRHLLRTQLGWLGFGNLGGGVWLAPRRVQDRAVEALHRLDLEAHADVFAAHHLAFGDVGSLVRRAWDLSGLDRRYAALLDTADRVLAGAPGADDRRPFVDHTLLVQQWRTLPYLDPGLPAAVLPPGWRGAAAAARFAEAADRLEGPARRWVDRVVGVTSPSSAEGAAG
jgi:phenylacetic acid degradation operon negative regulatory protein